MTTLFTQDHAGLPPRAPADWTEAELLEALQRGEPLAETELALRAAMRRLGLRDRHALEPHWKRGGSGDRTAQARRRAG